MNSMNTSIKKSKSLPLPMTRFTLMGICTGLRNTLLLHFQKENPGACGAMPGSGSNLIPTRRSLFPPANKPHTWATSVSHFQPKRGSSIYPCVSFHFIHAQLSGNMHHMHSLAPDSFVAYTERRYDEIWSAAMTLHLPGCVHPCRSRTAFLYHLR